MRESRLATRGEDDFVQRHDCNGGLAGIHGDVGKHEEAAALAVVVHGGSGSQHIADYAVTLRMQEFMLVPVENGGLFRRQKLAE